MLTCPTTPCHVDAHLLNRRMKRRLETTLPRTTSFTGSKLKRQQRNRPDRPEPLNNSWSATNTSGHGSTRALPVVTLAPRPPQTTNAKRHTRRNRDLNDLPNDNRHQSESNPSIPLTAQQRNTDSRQIHPRSHISLNRRVERQPREITPSVLPLLNHSETPFEVKPRLAESQP